MSFKQWCTPQNACISCYKWHAAAGHSDLFSKHDSAMQEQPQDIPLLTGWGGFELTLNISRHKCPQQQGHALGLGHILQDRLQLPFRLLAIEGGLPHTCTCQTSIKRVEATDKASTYTILSNCRRNTLTKTRLQQIVNCMKTIWEQLCEAVSKGLPGMSGGQHVLCSLGC